MGTSAPRGGRMVMTCCSETDCQATETGGNGQAHIEDVISPQDARGNLVIVAEQQHAAGLVDSTEQQESADRVFTGKLQASKWEEETARLHEASSQKAVADRRQARTKPPVHVHLDMNESDTVPTSPPSSPNRWKELANLNAEFASTSANVGDNFQNAAAHFLYGDNEEMVSKTEWSRLRVILAFVLEAKVPGTESQVFDLVMSTVILTNCVLMVMESDAMANCTLEDSRDCVPHWIEIMNWILLVIYSIEVAIRLYVRRIMFFTVGWNILDFVVVVVGWCSQLLDEWMGPQASKVNIFRVVRIARIIRVTKFLKHFPTLRSMLWGFAGAMYAMLWGLVLILFLLIFWGMLAVEFVHPVNKMLPEHSSDYCAEAFSSTMRATLLFFQTLVAGDSWGACVIPVIEEEPSTFILFAGVLVTVQLGFTNLVLAVIVDKATEAREGSKEEQRKEREKQELHSLNMLKAAMKALDEDESGTITIDEFKGGFHIPVVRETLEQFNVKEDDLEDLFTLMDADESGSLSYDEFVQNFVTAQTQDPRMYRMSLKLQIEKVAIKLERVMAEGLKKLVHSMFEEYSGMLGSRSLSPSGQFQQPSLSWNSSLGPSPSPSPSASQNQRRNQSQSGLSGTSSANLFASLPSNQQSQPRPPPKLVPEVAFTACPPDSERSSSSNSQGQGDSHSSSNNSNSNKSSNNNSDCSNNREAEERDGALGVGKQGSIRGPWDWSSAFEVYDSEGHKLQQPSRSACYPEESPSAAQALSLLWPAGDPSEKEGLSNSASPQFSIATEAADELSEGLKGLRDRLNCLAQEVVDAVRTADRQEVLLDSLRSAPSFQTPRSLRAEGGGGGKKEGGGRGGVGGGGGGGGGIAAADGGGRRKKEHPEMQDPTTGSFRAPSGPEALESSMTGHHRWQINTSRV